MRRGTTPPETSQSITPGGETSLSAPVAGSMEPLKSEK
jgi:hypothetical protein